MKKLGAAVFSAVLVLWLMWAFHPYIKNKSGFDWDAATSGQWGDTFGALNALFATFGFAAVILTLRLQQKQIKDAQDEQHRQRFESSYFELTKLLREIRNEARFRHTKEFLAVYPKWDVQRTGPNAFKYACLEVFFHIRNDKLLSKEGAGRVYENCVHNRFEDVFGPYFRVMYTIIYRIKTDSVLTQDDRHRYGNLLRSQLTSYELALAGLNGLSPVSKDFSNLLMEFRMFKYLPTGGRMRALKRYYAKQAFMARD